MLVIFQPAFLFVADSRVPWYWKWLARPLLARGFLNSIVVMEGFLVCQDINFTVLKPPQLLDDPLKGMSF